MAFHGVDYIVVPVELWDEAKEALVLYSPCGSDDELYINMRTYEGSNEPEELQ